MVEQHTPTHAIDVHLKFAALQGALLLLFVATITGVAQDWRTAALYYLQSSLLWMLVWHLAWRRKALNHDAVTTVSFAQLGWANRLTLLRGVLIAAVGGFLFQTTTVAAIAWLPALFYTAAAILDRLDGFIARRSGQTTQLGSELDTAYDAMGLAVAPLLAVGYGKVHWSFLLVSVAYYLFQGGLHLRRRLARPVYELTPSKLRRTMAGFQMGFVALALWPVFQAELTRIAGFAFMLPLLTGFVIDWLTITGCIRPERAPASEFLVRLAHFSARVLQPFVRITLAAMLLWLAHVANGPLMNGNAPPSFLLTHGLQACAILLATGVLARIGAVIGLLLLAWLLPVENVNAMPIVIVCCAVFVAVLGAGRFGIWQADDAWVNRND